MNRAEPGTARNSFGSRLGYPNHTLRKHEVKKAEEKYSAKHVKGSKAHVKFDVNEDHLEMIFQISYALLKSDAHFSGFVVVLKNISRLFREYFQELYEYAIVDNNQVVSNVAA